MWLLFATSFTRFANTPFLLQPSTLNNRKKLSKEDRAYWDGIALKDKERYMVEKASYTGPWQVPWKRAKKDPSAPKRPMSAFLYFSQGKRTLLKKEHPEMKNTEVSRLLGEMWRNAHESEKRPHIEKEKAEREKYKVAIAEWRKDSEAREKAQKLAVTEWTAEQQHQRQAAEQGNVGLPPSHNNPALAANYPRDHGSYPPHHQPPPAQYMYQPPPYPYGTFFSLQLVLFSSNVSFCGLYRPHDLVPWLCYFYSIFDGSIKFFSPTRWRWREKTTRNFRTEWCPPSFQPDGRSSKLWISVSPRSSTIVWTRWRRRVGRSRYSCSSV